MSKRERQQFAEDMVRDILDGYDFSDWATYYLEEFTKEMARAISGFVTAALLREQEREPDGWVKLGERLPTQTGWYWWRDATGSEVIFLYEANDVLWADDGAWAVDEMSPECEWCGPMQHPSVGTLTDTEGSDHD